MRKAVAQNMILDNNSFYISELILEQQSGLQNKRKVLRIPPVILLHMLDFLCCRKVDLMNAQAALDDIQLLVHNDQGWLADEKLENISWEILPTGSETFWVTQNTSCLNTENQGFTENINY